MPIAFKACGVFQACCDLGLGAQFWMWGDGPEGVLEGREKIGMEGVGGMGREKKVLSPVPENLFSPGLVEKPYGIETEKPAW